MKNQQFVYVYWAGGAESSEIDYSIRSVRKFIPAADIVVCGDRPDGYQGKFIPCPRINDRPFIQWHDSINKLIAILQSDLVQDRFCWMYDDTYFLKPTSIDEIAKPRSWTASNAFLHQMRRRAKSTWQAVKQETARLLYGERMTMFDFATHFPIVFSKSRLRQTIDRFDCRLRPVVIENLYLNQHLADCLSDCELSAPVRPHDFAYFRRPVASIEQLRVLSRTALCLNNGNGAFNSALRSFLEGVLS